jgi:hypothetical protein
MQSGCSTLDDPSFQDVTGQYLDAYVSYQEALNEIWQALPQGLDGLADFVASYGASEILQICGEYLDDTTLIMVDVRYVNQQFLQLMACATAVQLITFAAVIATLTSEFLQLVQISAEIFSIIEWVEKILTGTL